MFIPFGHIFVLVGLIVLGVYWIYEVIKLLPQDKISQASKNLAQFAAVSHCYQRKTFENWPYNLFAMMHGRSLGDIQRVIDKFIKTENIDSFELLPTSAELKKQPPKYYFY